MKPKHGQKNAIFGNCIAITARFQCDCTGGEVVSVTAMIDIDSPPGTLERAIGLMVKDLKFEIEQHLKNV
jgi:hypothetical protein